VHTLRTHSQSEILPQTPLPSCPRRATFRLTPYFVLYLPTIVYDS
jgi:hypothetical protein